VPYVTDLPSAGLVLVVTAGLSVHPVFVGTPGVTVEALDCLDRTQPIGALRLDDVAAPAIAADPETVHRAVTGMVHAGLAALTASQVGGADRCLELAAAYAGQRVQFGRIIGSYQAIKHRCADMLARVESARSAAYHLVATVAAGDPGVEEAAALAKAYCSEAYVACAGDMLQIHGGIGFTWEHDTHLYLKRAKAAQHLLGDPVHHRSRLASLLLGAA
jgi:alkylation response protein AidB-like acyl-CoA dehydrogenase